VLDKFKTSGFRYLHISCHANSKGVALTLDHVSVVELGELLRPYLDKRRVFFSACELATDKLASALLRDSGCYSVIAPSETIGFDEAALFWASLYHLMFKDDRQVMKRDELVRHLNALSSVFGVKMRYFSSSRSHARGFREVTITPNAKRSGHK
jgi:hypothetical protein